MSDGEFLAAFEAAPEPLQDVLALALLTGARQGELRALRREDLKEDGIHVHEGKTRKLRVVGWTDALRFFVNRALARQAAIVERPPNVLSHRRARRGTDRVLTNKFAEAWTLGGIQTAFKRLEVDWHFHDIRAKAASDSVQNILGHGAGMLGVYVRRQRVAGLR